jgi:predicted CXXCH cytochrome family protein
MKRIALLSTLLVLLLLISGSVALANFAIHGGYVADTDACAGCHRAHTATSMITWTDSYNNTHSALLVGPPTDQVYIFCYVCHSAGAPGAATAVEVGQFDSTSPGGATESQIDGVLNGGGFRLLNAQTGHESTGVAQGGTNSYADGPETSQVTSYHEYDGLNLSVDYAWGSGTTSAVTNPVGMDCASCHDPHGSSNYRILKDFVNGHNVGGYVGTFASDPDPDPYPYVISNEVGYPLKGRPDPLTGNPNPTDGFRLHRAYNDGDQTGYETVNGYHEYMPNYTTARYAKGRHPSSGSTDPDLGMAGWCTACHENYLAKVSIAASTSGAAGDPTGGSSDWGAARSTGVSALLTADITPSSTTLGVDNSAGFVDPGGAYTAYIQIETEVIGYTDISGNTFTGLVRGAGGPTGDGTPATTHTAGAYVYQAYNASDGNAYVARHRHPVNVPLSNFAGDRSLAYDPFSFQSNYPTTISFVDLPLAHTAWINAANPGEYGALIAKSPQGREQYALTDWIDCLTCHRAHGTNAVMQGYANAGLTNMDFSTLSNGQFTTWAVPTLGVTPGVPPTNDSALLRANNRGVCERCHNK